VKNQLLPSASVISVLAFLTLCNTQLHYKPPYHKLFSVNTVVTSSDMKFELYICMLHIKFLSFYMAWWWIVCKDKICSCCL